jgi:dienelactone hydrolase
MRLVPALTFTLTSLFTLSLPFPSHAQTPPPASPAPQPVPKKIPAPGLSLTTADRAELTAGTAALRAELDALARELASPADARLLALLPDVEIFPKAVAWALADDTFYSPKEIAFAKHLLAEGRERAAHLRAKNAPWLQARGLIVRGYRSKLDGSVQPYGLVINLDVDPSVPTPLMVWLLGRGEKRTELAFLAERDAGPPQLTPKATMTLVPYGRFCNATKFAGEVDVMEALAAVRAHYAIDPLRIAVAGFSMGGGSTWHLAPHYSGLWCAASPGAGFAETPLFTKALAPGKETRPAWEQLLWRHYEATGITANFFNVPTLAYTGDKDGQKEASDLMAAAFAREGLKLERFIGPDTAHKYHDATKAALTTRFEALIAQGRDPSPREVWLQTYTLRYPESAWVRIEGLTEHWQLAEVRATQHDSLRLEAHTKNVTAVSFPGINATTVVLDGQTVPAADASLHFHRTGDTWRAGRAVGLRKSPGLTGPVNDAFFEPFVFVRPSGKPLNPELGTWVESELTAARHLWRDVFRGDPPVLADTALTDADLTSKNLILWGDPTSNKVLAKLLATGKLPLAWDAKSLTFRGQTYLSAHHAPIFIFPNPLNPARYVVLNSGIDFRTEGYGNNAHQTPKLPDWAVVDLRTPPGPRWPGKIVHAGFFDEEWK